VVYGLPFGPPIDMWSLGVCLAELYSGRTLLDADSRDGLAARIGALIGPPPPSYGGGKYADELRPLAARASAAAADGSGGARRHGSASSSWVLPDVRGRLSQLLCAPPSTEAQQLMDLLGRLLVYDPSDRLTPAQAIVHPFFAPLFPFGALVRAPPAAGGAGAREPKEGVKAEAERGGKRKLGGA